MAQPRYGEIRITTLSGEGSRIVPIGDLDTALSEAHSAGGGVIEISTSLGIGLAPELSQIETRTCSSTDCPVTITKNPNKGRVIAAAKGFAIPESCLQCAGRQITSSAGILPTLTAVPVEISEHQ